MCVRSVKCSVTHDSLPWWWLPDSDPAPFVSPFSKLVGLTSLSVDFNGAAGRADTAKSVAVALLSLQQLRFVRLVRDVAVSLLFLLHLYSLPKLETLGLVAIGLFETEWENVADLITGGLPAA